MKKNGQILCQFPLYLVCHILVQHQREDLLQQASVRVPLEVLAPINEHVVFARVRMHIAVHRDSAILHQSVTHRVG